MIRVYREAFLIAIYILNFCYWKFFLSWIWFWEYTLILSEGGNIIFKSENTYKTNISSKTFGLLKLQGITHNW